MTRKERSEAYLQAHQVKINPVLPEIAPDAKVKPAEEILRRAVAAMLASQIAVDLASDSNVRESALFFTNLLERFGLENDLTPDEQKLFDLAYPDRQNTLTPADGGQLSWRIEMCMPLFWACGLLKGELPYPSQPSQIEGLVRILAAAEDFDVLRMLTVMRPAAEILDAADRIYRMDWACVDALVNRTEITGALNYDVVVEQHKGFNWMIGAYDAENWDNVKPHT